MHIGCWGHDAQHPDDEYDSDPENNFDQGATKKPLHSAGRWVRSNFTGKSRQQIFPVDPGKTYHRGEQRNLQE